MMMGMDGEMMDMDDGMMEMDGEMMTVVMCNGEMVDEPFMATGGTFQIYNTAVDVIATGEADAGSIMGADGSSVGMNGAEYTGYNLEGLDATVPPDNDLTDEAADTPTDAQPRDDEAAPTGTRFTLSDS